LADGKRIVLFAPWSDRLDLMQQELSEIIAAKGVKNVDVKGFVYEDLTSLTGAQKQAVDAADYVVLGSYSYDVESRTPGKYWVADFSAGVVDYANLTSKPLAVMALRNPYDIMYMPGVKAYLAVYGAAKGPNIPAGIQAVFGQVNPTGRLPVAIPDVNGAGTLYEIGHGLSYEPRL
jgi:beta-N-acetylhexosaminidase